MAQQLVGANMFLRGFIVTDWAAALADLDVDCPHNMMAWTLRFIWFDCTSVLWRELNNILHRNLNHQSILESARMDNTLQWFLDHQTSLAHCDQYLL